MDSKSESRIELKGCAMHFQSQWCSVSMARESKTALTERLREEGRLTAFRVRREGLKAQGVPARKAWVVAGEEFVPQAFPPDHEKPAPDLRSLRAKAAIPIHEAAAWVFEYLDADWIIPEDAPSAGAWSLLQWARTNTWTRSDFYRLFAAKFMPEARDRARPCKVAPGKKNLALSTIEGLLAQRKRPTER